MAVGVGRSSPSSQLVGQDLSHHHALRSLRLDALVHVDHQGAEVDNLGTTCAARV